MRLPRTTFSNSPAADVTWLPVDGGALALWTEPGALMVMPLDHDFRRAGDARQIGEAVSGTLTVVRTNRGALLVYARREAGSMRVVVRPAHPVSASPPAGAAAAPSPSRK